MRLHALAIVLAGCAPALPALRPHEVAAGAAARRAWHESGLPPPTLRKRCDVDSFRVYVATSPHAYKNYCPTANPSKSAGCLAWGTTDHWFFWRDYPIVVVSPIWHSEPSIVVHELMHAYTQCAELRTNPWDPADREHSDPRVWSAPGGAEAVQTRADKLTTEIE